MGPRLLERVGPTVAARLLFTSELVSARDAVTLGLVTESVEKGAAVERALAIASDIAKADRDVVAAQKALLRSAFSSSRLAIKEHEDRTFKALWGATAHASAMTRFATAKRGR